MWLILSFTREVTIKLRQIECECQASSELTPENVV